MSGELRTLAAYVSGHGFGHLTRSEAILERLAAAGVAIHLRTDQRALVLARSAPWAASVREVDSGPGAVQRGPLEVDVPGTRLALERHLAALDGLAAREAAALVALGAQAVYADVPPVGFEAARRAGLPSVGIANFSWSWIYASYANRDAAFVRLAARVREVERADLFLALPFDGGLEHFERLERLPLVTRTPTRTHDEARALLPIPAGDVRPVVLLSFGGFGHELDLARAARANPDYLFVAFSTPLDPPENLVALPLDHGLPHQDLVLGADALLGKPGYGTVSEAIVSRRAFVHCPRGEFPEFPILVRAIEEHLPHAALTSEDLLAGRWSEALEAALSMAPPETGLATNGAEVAARRILEWFRRGGAK